MLATFDVFETLLTRPYAVPEDLFVHLSEVLVKLGLVPRTDEFVIKRVDAEAEAWRNGGKRRGAAIDEIYSILAKQYQWNQTQAGRAMSEEIRLELIGTRAVPDGVIAVEEARQRGHKICFISDMHLREVHIRQMLAKTGILRVDDPLIVSSDAKMIKATGELFRKALITMNSSPKHSYHLGDSVGSDFRGAKLIGMRTTLYTRTHLDRFEKAILTRIDPGHWRLRALAAVSKTARLVGPSDPLRELFVSTIAPFVAAYALWLIAEAASRGIHNLYFLARDMQIVHEVAEFLAAKLGANLKCHYIYGSRRSWQPAGYVGPDDWSLFWLTDKMPAIDPKRVLARLIADEDLDRISAYLAELAPDKANWDREDIRSLLVSERIRPLVENAVKEKRALLLSYLAHCGHVPTEPFALVDTGWRGSLQNCVARALRAEGIEAHTVGFYVGLRHVGKMEPGTTLLPFLPNDLVNRLGFSLGSILEALLTSNHGSTTGYSICEGKPQPVLGPRPAERALAQWSVVRESCLTYAEALSKSPAWELPKPTLIGPLTIPFLLFCERPLAAESRLLREWVFDAGRDQQEFRSLVGRLRLKDFAKLVRARLRKQPLADVYLSSPWTHGAIAASPWPQRLLANWLSRH